ncbi:MAG: hypothetical protein ACR2NX_14100 [Chthoniobacterales bacterium]
MKKYFFAAIFATAAAAGTAHAQSFSAPVNGKPKDNVRRFAPVTSRTGEVGAATRAVRGGNPLQMINPRAPQRYYGTPDATFTYDSYNPSHVTGLIFFGLRW